MREMNEIKAIVFDMDGVLFDTEKMWLDAWSILSKEHNIPDIDATARLCIGLSVTDTIALLKRIYGDNFPVDEYHTQIAKIVHERIESEGMIVKTGVRDILDFLYEKEFAVGLASSTKHSGILKNLERAGLTKYFSYIIGGDMIKNSKPDPEIYCVACEKLGVEPCNAVAIEDSKNGIISASRAGLMPLMVPDLVQPTDEILAMTYGCFDNLIDVKSFLSMNIK